MKRTAKQVIEVSEVTRSLRVLSNHVAVEVYPERAEVKGLALPEGHRWSEQYQLGKVMVCGPKANDRLSTGTDVYFIRYAGHHIQWGSKDVRILRDQELIAAIQ